VLLALTLSAAAGMSEDAPPLQGDLDTVERELAQSREQQERIRAGIEAGVREQEELSAKLVTIAGDIQGSEAALSAAEGRILELSKEAVVIRAALAEKQDVLSDLLAGIQRLDRNPPPALVVEPHDVLSALRGAMMFGAIVPEMREEAAALAGKLARLDEIKASVEAEKQDMAARIEDLEKARTDIAALTARKKELLADANRSLKEENRRARELAGRAKTLAQLLADLAEEKSRAEAERLEAEAAARTEREKAEAAAAAERRRIEDALRAPRLAFADARHKLPYPAQGRIVKNFGEDDGLGTSLRGIVIATRDGAQVIAPADGEVEFAGPFRSYGQLLILNTGGGYHVVMAGMNLVSAELGQHVRAGEPVGTMGRSPAPVILTGGELPEEAPALYVEFRKNGEAIDSAPWWVGDVKEARG
jgi:septal ring factor EnvC (AmiA/AmiB activator)